MELSNIVRISCAHSRRNDRPDRPILALHFDLACVWLTDRGWKATCPNSTGSKGSYAPALSTDAPPEYLSVALAVAHLDLCEFLVEAHGFSSDQLPNLLDLQSTKIVETNPGSNGGWVYVHG